jgi:beta-glucanase (GH16 family)
MLRLALGVTCVLLALAGARGAAVGEEVGAQKPVDPADCTSYPCLIFEDNFDTFNMDTWQHEMTAGGGGNWEFQYYTNNRSNSYVRDGNLFIKPTLTEDKYGAGFVSSGTLDLWGGTPASVCTSNAYYGCLRAGNAENYINPVQSARLRSVDSFTVRYGRIEVSAKMPTGDWIWPAIWMMSKRENYGGWPASGEIDIVEARGNLDLQDESGVQKGVNAAASTMHWGPFFPYNGYAQTTGERHSNYGQTFHTYAVEWDEAAIRLYIDNELVVDASPPAGGFWEMGNFGLGDQANPWVNAENKVMAPFDTEFYFLLNVAVGGTNGYFPDTWTNANGAKPWSNQSPTSFREFWNARDTWYPTWNPTASNGENAAMQIDYIRVWKQKADAATKK